MLDIEIRGAEEFGVLSRRLKETGDKGLQKELRAGLQRAGKEGKDAVRPSLATVLPRKGGLAAQMAAGRVSLRAAGAGRNPRVRIVATTPHDLRSMDKGRLRHPVFGHKTWVQQVIEPGAFSKPIEERAPQMREDMEQVIRSVAAKVGGRG